MKKYREIAKRVASISSEEGIRVEQLPRIVSDIDSIGDNSHDNNIQMNCYPGIKNSHCYPFCLFVSLNASLRKGRGWHSFSQTLEFLVQHFQGKCRAQTREGVLITDTWESWTYEKWEYNVKEIQRGGVYLEFYLIGKGGWVIDMPF
jgi:hypothetical protein